MEFSNVFGSKLYCAEALSYLYQHYRLCPPIILSWNPKSQQFSRSPNFRLQLFCALVILSLLSGGSSVFIVMFPSNFRLVLVMLASVFVPCACLVTSSSLVMYFYCDDIILAFQRMKRLLEQLEWQYPMTFSEKRRRELEKLDQEWKMISFLLKTNVQSLIPMKWLMPIFVTFKNLDPYYAIYIFYGLSSTVYDKIARFTFAFISFTVGTQTYGVTVLTLFLWLEMQSRYLHGLRRISNCDQFFHWYAKFHIVSKTWHTAVSEWIRNLMSSFFWLIVVCTVVSIRYFGEVPIQVFWFMPTAAIMNGLMLYIIFPYLTGCQEETQKLLHERKRQRQQQRRLSPEKVGKWGKVKLRSLKPVAMHCGDTFSIKKQTKSEFFSAIVQRTLDGILV